MDEITRKALEILKRPYVFVIYEDDGGFSGYVKEFEGCVTCDDTVEKTSQRLRDTAESWVESQMANGGQVPLCWLDWKNKRMTTEDTQLCPCDIADTKKCMCKGSCTCHWVQT